MDISDIALRLVGAFYAFAGVVATRATITAALLDKAIAQISLQKRPLRDRARMWWLFAASVAIFAGGLTLVAQLEAAQWIFVASALGQAVYLAILAPFYFDAEEPPDAVGRKGTINAFVLYVAATAFVLWGGGAGKLKSFADAGPAAIAIAATGLAVYLAYLVKTAWLALRPAATPAPIAEDDDPGGDDDAPRNPSDP
ncbi:MAG: hypothetical protein ACT4OU_13190 [Hyphomicrobium sp.]